MELRDICRGRMLPPIDVGPEQYEPLAGLCVSAVTNVTGVTSEEIFGRGRPQRVVDARQMAYKTVRHEIGVGVSAVKYGSDDKCPSLEWIASLFGRTHGAVSHGLTQISGILATEKKVYDVYVRVLSCYEVSRASYLSLNMDKISDLQIQAMKRNVESIQESISQHEEALSKAERELNAAIGGRNENMVQEQCPSNG